MDDKAAASVFLSVVIPAYNEDIRISRTIAEVRRHLGRQPYSGEIIVVDDGSSDKTCGLARKALEGMKPSRVLRREQNCGKGFSVREGILTSNGEWVLFTDADLSTPIQELAKLLDQAEKGYPVVIGSRALPESEVQVHQSFVRELMGKMFNVLVQLLVVRGIKDTQCGFKLFRRDVALHVFPQVKTRGFSFDVEVLLLCQNLGYPIKQVPVIWRNSPQSKVRIFSSSLEMMSELWAIRRSRKNLPLKKSGKKKP